LGFFAKAHRPVVALIWHISALSDVLVLHRLRPDVGIIPHTAARGALGPGVADERGGDARRGDGRGAGTSGCPSARRTSFSVYVLLEFGIGANRHRPLVAWQNCPFLLVFLLHRTSVSTAMPHSATGLVGDTRRAFVILLFYFEWKSTSSSHRHERRHRDKARKKNADERNRS